MSNPTHRDVYFAIRGVLDSSECNPGRVVSAALEAVAEFAKREAGMTVQDITTLSEYTAELEIHYDKLDV